MVCSCLCWCCERPFTSSLILSIICPCSIKLRQTSKDRDCDAFYHFPSLHTGSTLLFFVLQTPSSPPRQSCKLEKIQVRWQDTSTGKNYEWTGTHVYTRPSNETYWQEHHRPNAAFNGPRPQRFVCRDGRQRSGLPISDRSRKVFLHLSGLLDSGKRIFNTQQSNQAVEQKIC